MPPCQAPQHQEQSSPVPRIESPRQTELGQNLPCSQLLPVGELAWLQLETAALAHSRRPCAERDRRPGALAASWAHSAGTGTERSLGLWRRACGLSGEAMHRVASRMAETCRGCELLLASWPPSDPPWLKNDPSANHTGQPPHRYLQPQRHTPRT